MMTGKGGSLPVSKVKLWVRFHPITIEPGQLCKYLERSKIPEGCVPRRLEVEHSSPNMVVNFLRSGGKDLLISRSALPAGNLDTTAFSKIPLDADADLSMGVTNLADGPQTFSATLYFEVVGQKEGSMTEDELRRIIDKTKMLPEDLEDEPGLLSRCRAWFRQGIEAAVSESKLGSKEIPTISVLASPARVRDSIRRLVSQLVDVAEIPLTASALYWQQIVSAARGDDLPGTFSASKNTRLDTKVTGRIFKNNGQEVPPDEFIVFRPADNAVPDTLEFYYRKCMDLKADPAQLAAVMSLIDRVQAWREAHPDRLKVPDVAPGELENG